MSTMPPINTQDANLKVHVSDIGIVVNATTRFRRLPPLFPAQSHGDLETAAWKWLDGTYFADLAEKRNTAKLMADFAAELASPERPSDGDKQRSCDEAHGHVLQVQHNNIIKCRDCNAEWRAQGD